MKTSMLCLLSAAFALSACNGVSVPGAEALSGPAGNSAPTASPPAGSPPSGSQPRSFQTGALIFVGSGSWTTEIADLESILKKHGVSYQTANDSQINAMTLDAFAQFGMFLWPGGSGTQQLAALNGATREKIREAVINRGVSFLGFCAGAFLAVSPEPAAGQNPQYLSVWPAPILNYYYLENQGVTFDMTHETFADGKTADLLWYGGPVTPNVSGGVVAHYPDGNPAISEAFSGEGFVIVSGVHPSISASELKGMGLNPADGGDHQEDVAWKLISAALNRAPLAAF